MFRIAKSIPTFQEESNIQIVEVSVGNFDSITNKTIYTYKKSLEINLFGEIDNDEYCLHFIITKPIDEY